MLRLADAFNLEKVIFTGVENIDTRKVKKVSRNALQFVNYELAYSTLEILDIMRSQGRYIIALELHPNAIPLKTFQFPIQKDIALVVGNEISGLPESILTICDTIVYIPMQGKNSSMNVTSATAIALYEISSKF